MITNIPPLQPSASANAAALTRRLGTLLQQHEPDTACLRFGAHQYLFAVDRDLGTSWATPADIAAGDYFGLDMLRLRKDVVNISATVAHLEHEHFVLEVSLRGVSLRW